MHQFTLPLIVCLTMTLVGCESSSPTSPEPSEKGAPETKAASQPTSSGSSEAQSTSGELAIGDSAPRTERQMKSVDGQMASVASVAKEKGVLVIFTCNHCPWVKAWQERTVRIANSLEDLKIGVIAINPNDPNANAEDSFEGMKARAEQQGMKYPYVVDEGSVMARAYGATKTPEFFLFDGDLELVYHGALDDNAQKPDQVTKTHLDDAVKALAQGEPIPISQTKAFGCGIKFQDAS